MLISIATLAQDKTTIKATDTDSHCFGKHSNVFTVAVGLPYDIKNAIINQGKYSYRNDYQIVALYLKYERALTKNIGIGISFGYCGYSKNLQSGTDYIHGTLRVYSVTPSLSYHLGRFLELKKVDPYISAGATFRGVDNYFDKHPNSNYDNNSFTDILPAVRLGARVYLLNFSKVDFGFSGELGFDGMSFFSLGIMCRGF